MTDNFAARLDAVERALTDGETDIDELPDAADVEERLTALEAQAESFDDRLAELEAAVQAVRGYVGGIRAVNRDVERRADAALATAESLTEAVDDAPRVDARELPESATGSRTADTVPPESQPATEDDDFVERLRRVL